MSGGPVPYDKKYTAASRGVWNWIRSKLAMVPNRSSGNPIVNWYRDPTPGSQPSNDLKHTVGELPAIDIANNPYWKRDYRRHYPQTSAFDQSALAGLLTYGSVAQPKIAKGDEGAKQLATVANGELSLPAALESKQATALVLDSNGLPPLPAPFSNKTYTIVTSAEVHGQYPVGYPVRIFN